MSQAKSSPSSPSRSSASAPAKADGTRTVHFHAFTANGRATTRVRPAGSGSCFTSAITVPGRRAYRCFKANEILDPCFASPAQAEPSAVVCYADPWSSGQRITLTKPLPDVTPIPHPRPWALELANGARCLSITGIVQADHGVALAYHCGHDHVAGLITGHGRRLVAGYALAPRGPLHRVAVTTVWTG